MGRSRRPRPARLAIKLKEIRTKLNLTQEQVFNCLASTKTRMRPGHISEFEMGKREPPLPILLAYSRLAGVFLDVLVDDAIDLPEKIPASSKYEWALRRTHRS
jgi:transcriptional regulator with XRE-family HTH domain